MFLFQIFLFLDMNYEQLLDEIMINTLSAKELIGTPQKDLKFWVCPRSLEFHATIFLTGALLAFDQHKPIIFMIQVPELSAPALLYQWEIGPHFGRTRNKEKIHGLDIAQTSENHYPYLDKLFAYLGVINPHPEHLVIFVKQGEKDQNLTSQLTALLEKNYSLLVISNAYSELPTWESKKLSNQLIQSCKNHQMQEEEQKHFSAFSYLSELSENYTGNIVSEILMNTGEMGLDHEKSTSMRCMLR